MSNSFDWNSFNKLFQQFFPQGTNTDLGPQIDLSWINKHIEETLNQALPQSPSRGSAAPSYSFDIIEIHNYIIVKFKLSESEARKVRLSVTPNQLKLHNDTTKKREVIKLPALIRTDSGKAIYKNGVLEIRLLKQEISERFSDLEIRFI